MPNELANPEVLLELKSKAYRGEAWTPAEEATIRLALKQRGPISILAASCILASRRLQGDSASLDTTSESLGIIREALQYRHLAAYVELSIYEALVQVESRQLASFYDVLLTFIQDSLLRRSINLDNTIFLLGRLARVGEPRALNLLHSLEHDNQSEIRENAGLVLSGLKSGC